MIVHNGELKETAWITLDRGFYFGMGVFETLHMKGRVPVLLPVHIKRLNDGLKALGLTKQVDLEEMKAQIALLDAKDCVIKLVVSEDNVLLTKRPMPYTKEHYEKGFSLKVSDVLRNPKSHLTYLKTLNYIDNGLEREIAQGQGFDEALFLNFNGYVTEGSFTNLFCLWNGKIHTPSETCGLLPGVLRAWVMAHYPVEVGSFTLEQLLSCEGVFVTNSLLGIMKVVQINDQRIPVNPMIEDIFEAYNSYLKQLVDL